ncbi:BTB/POZ domain-containing protein 9 isoform X3 [Stegostoma tigrinum]|nr:BTB/POZ domain-containing protein 9 isoform X3 [Stegostoma tigrinum]
MREAHSQAEIPLEDTPAEAFTMLLKYIYTGQVTLSNEKEEILLDFLSLAHKYGFPELEDATSEYLCTILSINNVCMVYDVASLYSLQKLSNTCCLYMDRNAKAVLSSDGFLSLSKAALLNVVSRDSFAAAEKDIFLALVDWCKLNPNERHVEIMKAVRLPLMSLTELLNVVRPAGLLSADTILDAIKIRSESRDMELNYRGMLIPEENIAAMKYGAQVIGGELKAALLDGDTQNYDLDHGFCRHPIDEDCRSGIEVKLGQASILNHIRMLLWDRDSRSYSYYIEVSMDELDWIRIVDHSNYLCRSWQNLFFTPRVCRYIRVVGTHNTVNKVFHLVSFECMFTNKPFSLDAGLLGYCSGIVMIEATASTLKSPTTSSSGGWWQIVQKLRADHGKQSALSCSRWCLSGLSGPITQPMRYSIVCTLNVQHKRMPTRSQVQTHQEQVLNQAIDLERQLGLSRTQATECSSATEFWRMAVIILDYHLKYIEAVSNQGEFWTCTSLFLPILYYIATLVNPDYMLNMSVQTISYSLCNQCTTNCDVKIT